MCYNYSLNPEDQKQVELVNIGNRKPFKPEDLRLFDDEPFYYVSGFSHTNMPVVYIDEYTGLSWGRMRWGLIFEWPKYKKDLYKMSANPLNSRDDSIFTNRNYNHNNFGHSEDNWDIIERRCLVPMTGFFDSHALSDKDKYPFYIRLKSRETFFVGGIWRQIRMPESDHEVQCFSMITTEPNEKMRLIHNQTQRMLNILPEGEEHLWLKDDLTSVEIKELIKSYPDNDMYAHPIDKFYNNSRNHRNVTEAFDETHVYDLELSGLLSKLESIN